MTALRLLWPVVDSSFAFDELVATAAPQVPWMAHQQLAEITEPGVWRVDEAEAWEGYDSYLSVLVCEALAVRVEHGTQAGYRWHKVAGRPACLACAGTRLAAREYGGFGGFEVGRD